LVFFFSSRRRHTRFSRDWSSDVCSSDLGAALDGGQVRLDLAVALLDLGLIGLIQLAGLPEGEQVLLAVVADQGLGDGGGAGLDADRKSTRLNSSHVKISYAVFCLKKKKH